MLEIVSIETDSGLSDDTFSILSNFISNEKREKITRLRRRQDAVNTLLGEIVVRHTICAGTGLANDEIEILNDKYGKPYIANMAITPGLYFNISHSGDLLVCAVSDAPVGVDIELIRAAYPDITKRVFRDDEYDFVMSGPDMPGAAFFQIWTMKESYVKWEGSGLSTPLNSFSVLELKSLDRPFFHCVDVRTDACCHVCTDIASITSHRHYMQEDFLSICFHYK